MGNMMEERGHVDAASHQHVQALVRPRPPPWINQLGALRKIRRLNPVGDGEQSSHVHDGMRAKRSNPLHQPGE